MATEKRLIEAIEAEMPNCPVTDYEIGYQNGLSMAKAIALKLDAADGTADLLDVQVKRITELETQ